MTCFTGTCSGDGFMHMKLDYEELRNIAMSTRYARSRSGWKLSGIRKKPRDPEKTRMLYERVRAIAEIYPPSVKDDGSILLPYFCQDNSR
jgi:hypothetical protein